MSKVKAFISYSMVDREWAARVKGCLDTLEIESFIAHNDLVISEEWKVRILEELRTVDLFICLLSKDFKASDWCSQEVGFIASRPEVVVIPVSIDGTVSFGFINHIQSQTVSRPSELEIEGLIINALLRKKPDMGIALGIKRMLVVRGYRTAEDITKRLMPFFSIFSAVQAEAFAEAAVKNAVVWDAGECATKILPKFIEVCSNHLADKTLKALRFQITERMHYKE